MAKQVSTYRKEIAALRGKLPQAKYRSTARAMNQRIRELAAVLSGRKPGEWHEITLSDAERITGEQGG